MRGFAISSDLRDASVGSPQMEANGPTTENFSATDKTMRTRSQKRARPDPEATKGALKPRGRRPTDKTKVFCSESRRWVSLPKSATARTTSEISSHMTSRL